ncbi:MAG TPA: hypothetical protein VIK63_03875 [Haloplasmataceae bacterium]
MKDNRYDYHALRHRKLHDRYTKIDYHNPFKGEDVEFSAEGLGGSSIKRGHNIINQEQYFREKSKQLVDKEALQEMIDELPF